MRYNSFFGVIIAVLLLTNVSFLYAQKTQTLISGKIEGLTDRAEIKVKYDLDLISGDEEIVIVKVPNHGQFYVPIHIQEITWGKLYLENELVTHFTLEPGIPVVLNFNVNYPTETIEFGDQGGTFNSIIHQTLVWQTFPFEEHSNNEILPFAWSNNLGQDLNRNDLVDFISNASINLEFNRNVLLLENDLSKDQHDYILNLIAVDDNAAKIIFKLEKNNDVELKLFHSNFAKSELLNSPIYRNFVRAALGYHVVEKTDTLSLENVWKVSTLYFFEDVRAYVMASVLISSIRPTNGLFVKDRIKTFERLFPNSTFSEIIREKLIKWVGSGVGDQALDFVFSNTNGNPVALSDFKGSVVFLSFWASWCKPCISNFEKWRELKKELTAKGVVFLNVSIDAKSEIWKRSLTKMDINGIHVIASDKDDPIRAAYQLYALPSYFLIDQNGVIQSLELLDTVEVTSKIDELIYQ